MACARLLSHRERTLILLFSLTQLLLKGCQLGFELCTLRLRSSSYLSFDLVHGLTQVLFLFGSFFDSALVFATSLLLFANLLTQPPLLFTLLIANCLCSSRPTQLL